MPRYEQAEAMARFFKKYYRSGVSRDELIRDGRQPFKSNQTIGRILDYMVKNNMVERVALTVRESKNAPALYYLREEYEPQVRYCGECGQEIPDPDFH